MIRVLSSLYSATFLLLVALGLFGFGRTVLYPSLTADLLMAVGATSFTLAVGCVMAWVIKRSGR